MSEEEIDDLELTDPLRLEYYLSYLGSESEYIEKEIKKARKRRR